MKIFIDPGHRCPPEDRGAIGYLNEEDVAFAVAKELGKVLKERGCEVLFSNATDGSTVRASLSQRCAQSNRFSPDLYISLHCNAFRTTPEPMGTEVFAASTKGEAFASRILKNIVKFGFKVHAEGVRDGSHLYVIRNTEDPAILVELFFIDSDSDCILYESIGAEKMAIAIADAIAPQLIVSTTPAAVIPVAVSSTPLAKPSIIATSAGASPSNRSVRSGYLADAAKFYAGENHQINAWTYLQSQIPDSTLVKFQEIYSPKKIPARESVRPKFDPHNIDWSNPNCRISEFFTVGEVTKGDPARTPKIGSQQEKNILALAIELDKLRKAFGHPLGVTSWYRPPAVNEAVGGVPNSQHIHGLAADVYPLSGMSIEDFQTWCEEVWYGCVGRGFRKGFVHLDMRNGSGFMTGGEKGVRWDY